MKRSTALRLSAVAGVAAIGGGIALGLPQENASAATNVASGFASANGGTTGGAGGTTVRATTGTQIHEALCKRAAVDTPIVIEVQGTINHGNTTKVTGDSCNTAADRIELKGVSNVTIVGVGSGATFDQLGIHLRDARNIIVQNVTVKNVKKSGSPLSNGGDAIGMESTVRNVWVDHVTLEASGGESEGFDGLFDMKDDVQYVTLSYSVLRNSGRGGLVGSSETDTGNSFITYHHNKYENIDSRTPLLRGGVAHMFNNHYLKLNESGINSRAGAKAKVDNNYFEDSKDVLGTFYTDAAGTWQTSGNVLDNVTWSAKSAEYNPAGPAMASTTSVTVPYTFALDTAACVPTVIAQTAGAGTGLKVSDGKCAVTAAPSSSATKSPTAAPSSSPAKPSSSPATSPSAGPTASVPPAPSGTNLSIGAGADGSSKAAGTSYGNVRDGKTATVWSPNGATGDISIKWSTATKVSKVTIVGANIGSYELRNGSTGAILKSGTGTGAITFPATSLTKLTFTIKTSSGTPSIAEFQTYAS
ncbi:putative pectate lyase [Actinoplanes missouriensis 431]|uniref:Putative pectate lyase n=1 Tax=Actinoplanes missouriensis (strain ATCC 14538 / DSM 43046 / CBS 188.64 / JCM 3121 / NBRC 102363 / NCIMB 12654 / NRRL B-3342 / UNCC 431) TaxID=512565 RepID=I0H407_ACTM4|nr:pectate lyase [Actinoplanes missouriensis]BAL87744.1 putative pectate lyase [Actinoplanes missouriensis 431]